MKHFIIFTNEDLDKMKSGQMVVCEKCNFSESKDDPYDIYCVSEEWMNQYNSWESLPQFREVYIPYYERYENRKSVLIGNSRLGYLQSREMDRSAEM